MNLFYVLGDIHLVMSMATPTKRADAIIIVNSSTKSILPWLIECCPIKIDAMSFLFDTAPAKVSKI